MMRRHYPDTEPRQRVMGWGRSLSGSEWIGVDFDDDLTRAVFEALLDGCSGATLCEQLKAEFDPDKVDAQAEAIDRYAGRMQQPSVPTSRETALTPLFRSSA
jgi:hypothetical protein